MEKFHKYCIKTTFNSFLHIAFYTGCSKTRQSNIGMVYIYSFLWLVLRIQYMKGNTKINRSLSIIHKNFSVFCKPKYHTHESKMLYILRDYSVHVKNLCPCKVFIICGWLHANFIAFHST